jgi:mersacidin/lichenicidin family type 2 lantibiotic
MQCGGRAWLRLSHGETKEDLMKSFEIVRGWKDEEYRRMLSDEQRAALPENPAGLTELTDVELGAVGGGEAPPEPTHYFLSIGCCTLWDICGSQWVGTYGCCPELPLQ